MLAAHRSHVEHWQRPQGVHNFGCRRPPAAGHRRASPYLVVLLYWAGPATAGACPPVGSDEVPLRRLRSSAARVRAEALWQLQASVRSPLELMNFSRQVAAGIDVTVVRGYAGAGIEL